jgi:hypothetical protein
MMRITKNTRGIRGSIDYVDTQEIKKLNKFKSNWESLKDLLYLTIDNYGDDEDIDTSVAEQILEEMNKLESTK